MTLNQKVFKRCIIYLKYNNKSENKPGEMTLYQMMEIKRYII